MNPESEQFQPLTGTTEPAPQVEEKDNDNMNGNEEENVVAKTTPMQTSAPTCADPCGGVREHILKGKFRTLRQCFGLCDTENTSTFDLP